MKSEVYEVQITQAPETVIAGPIGLTVRRENRDAAQAEFAKWTSMPEGRIVAVSLVRITTEVVARWPE